MKKFAVRLNKCHIRDILYLDDISFKKYIPKLCISIINKNVIDRHQPFFYIDISNINIHLRDPINKISFELFQIVYYYKVIIYVYNKLKNHLSNIIF